MFSHTHTHSHALRRSVKVHDASAAHLPTRLHLKMRCSSHFLSIFTSVSTYCDQSASVTCHTVWLECHFLSGDIWVIIEGNNNIIDIAIGSLVCGLKSTMWNFPTIVVFLKSNQPQGKTNHFTVWLVKCDTLQNPSTFCENCLGKDLHNYPRSFGNHGNMFAHQHVIFHQEKLNRGVLFFCLTLCIPSPSRIFLFQPVFALFITYLRGPAIVLINNSHNQ